MLACAYTSAVNNVPQYCMKERADVVRLIQGLSADERLWQPDPCEWLKEQDRADHKTKLGGQDRQDRARIDIDENAEIRDRCKSVGNQADSW